MLCSEGRQRLSGDEGAQKCRSGVVEQCAAKRNPITGNRDKVRITDLGLSGIICLNLYLWPSTVQKLHSSFIHAPCTAKRRCRRGDEKHRGAGEHSSFTLRFYLVMSCPGI